MPAATPPLASGRRRIALAILLGLGVLTQALLLQEQIGTNPLAGTPVNDARVYWTWAGEIAAGKLVGDVPFLSAPLYPYLLAIVRALGGGLETVYVLQAALHVATVAFLFRVVERRFGTIAGLAGALVFLALTEPAYATARVLSGPLQVFVVVWLWDRLAGVDEEPRRGRMIGLGAVLGVNVLANPAMLAAVPLVAGWAWWRSGRGGLGAATRVAAASLVVVAPATLHNLLACGELIPVSAQGGVTFFHGNAPGAEGVYHGIEGIAENRLQQNLDARALASGETDGSWRATSAYFFRKGLRYWASDPAAAARLLGRKLWFFLSARNYGDIYVPAIEREDGLTSRLALVPVPTAWITVPGLLLLLLLLRDPRRAFPEVLLVLAPLLVVVAFWYSPRYRMPAVPVLAGLAGVSLVRIVDAARRRRVVLAAGLAASWALALGSGAWNRKSGFDAPDSLRAQHQQMVGSVLVEQGRLEEAERRYRAALAGGFAPAGPALADVLRRLGRTGDALEMLASIVQEQPESAYAHRSYAVALAQAGRFEEAESEFRRTIAIDGNDWEALSGLGNVLHATNRVEEAIAMHRAAIARNPAYAGAHYNLGYVLMGLGRLAEAEAELREALRLDPSLDVARRYLDELRRARGGGSGGC